MTDFIPLLDDDHRRFLQAMPTNLVDLNDIPETRRNTARMVAELMVTSPPSGAIDIADRFADGYESDETVRMRVYRPKETSADGAAGAPAILWIHGGGMVMGSVVSEEGFCQETALQLGAVVVSVEYRLAPENPYPAPLNDCYAALLWLVKNADDLGVDPGRIAVAGISAGGGLAAGLALKARDLGGPAIAGQLLVYPMLDDRNDTPSSHAITEPRVWNRESNLIAWRAYLGERADNPPIYAAPARASDLSGLPPAFISTGEFDLFRDENIAYTELLRKCGVDAELVEYPKTFHASNRMLPNSPVSMRWNADQLDAFARLLSIDVSDRKPWRVRAPSPGLMTKLKFIRFALRMRLKKLFS